MDAFSAKELSPEFTKVITERVVNNVELNAEDNSQSRSYLYETVSYIETRFHR